MEKLREQYKVSEQSNQLNQSPLPNNIALGVDAVQPVGEHQPGPGSALRRLEGEEKQDQQGCKENRQVCS